MDHVILGDNNKVLISVNCSIHFLYLRRYKKTAISSLDRLDIWQTNELQC